MGIVCENNHASPTTWLSQFGVGQVTAREEEEEQIKHDFIFEIK